MVELIGILSNPRAYSKAAGAQLESAGLQRRWPCYERISAERVDGQDPELQLRLAFGDQFPFLRHTSMTRVQILESANRLHGRYPQTVRGDP
eukprot:755317-Hanusia_phi.AAC.8